MCIKTAHLPALAVLCGFAVLASRTAGGELTGEIRVHDPSTIVPCAGRYWLFATGRGIMSRSSKDLRHWERGPSVFSAPPAWTRQVVPGNRGYFWAPDIIYHHQKFWLYYSVSTWGRNTSAIGLATNPTLDPAATNYAWTDWGVVVRSAASDDFNTIDPCVFGDPDGSLWLGFGSYWSGIKLVQLDPGTGQRISTNSPIHSLAQKGAIEAPFLFRRGSFYYLFVNWDRCCNGVNSTYNIRLGRSASVTGPYLDRSGVDLMNGGGTLILGTEGEMIGPGHAGILTADGTDWLSHHYYDGTSAGRGTLGLRKIRWEDGWPGVAK